MAQNGFDRAGRIVVFDGNAYVRQGVGIAARLVQRRELLGIVRQRPVRSQRHPASHQLEGAIQPHRDAVVLEQVAVRLLCKCAAAQRHHRGAALLDGADVLADDPGFDAPELRLASCAENLRDGGLPMLAPLIL